MEIKVQAQCVFHIGIESGAGGGIGLFILLLLYVYRMVAYKTAAGLRYCVLKEVLPPDPGELLLELEPPFFWRTYKS